MIETLGRAGLTLAEALEREDDLEGVKRALVREQVIRETMAETGEDRQTVTHMADAMASMGQEAVLDLTEGEPTTLADALSRYVERLQTDAQARKSRRGWTAVEEVTDALIALLAYPWPDGPVPMNAVLKVDNPDDERLVISVGGVEVAKANHDEHGWSGMELAQRTAEAVHRAVLAACRVSV